MWLSCNAQRIASNFYCFLTAFLHSMSSAFVPTPRTGGGYDVSAWLRDNWDVAKFRGDDLIATHDGSCHPVKECAVVFRNFRPAAGAYFADPITVVQYRSAMLTAIQGTSKYEHPVVIHNDVLVPLGTPDWSNAQTRVVLQQSARQWVSGGRNTADMSDEHVITLYYAALQQLVFAAGNATRAADQRRWFPALVALTQAFGTIHAEYEAARKVTAALVLTPGANDMIQKGLAYVFHSVEMWSKESRLDMLAIAIRRNLRRGTVVAGMAPGPFVLFVLVPLLRTVVYPEGTVLEDSTVLLEHFNSAASELLHAFIEDASGEAEDFNARVFVSLTTAAGIPLTVGQVRDLLNHIATTDASSDPDWVKLGVLCEPPTFAATVLNDRFRISARNITYRVKVKHTSTDHIDAYSYKGVEWAALGFNTPGEYTIRANDLGIAVRATGDSRGDELSANWRITAGMDILPAMRSGYSLAGQEYKLLPSGRWGYVSSPPLTLDDPFTVIVEPTRLQLLQGARHYFTMEKCSSEPMLLAFKNLWLHVHYTAPPPLRTPTAHASQHGREIVPTHKARVHDLPPTALIARLRELAISEMP
jgi:hypothetical protein